MFGSHDLLQSSPGRQARVPPLIVFQASWTSLFITTRSMRTMSYADKTITCRDCGMDFIFTSGEQEFYAQKGFTNEPTRCASCRQQRKAGGGGRSGGYGSRERHGG